MKAKVKGLNRGAKVTAAKAKRNVKFVCPACEHEHMGLKSWDYWHYCNPTAPFRMYPAETIALTRKVVDSIVKMYETERPEYKAQFNHSKS